MSPRHARAALAAVGGLIVTAAFAPRSAVAIWPHDTTFGNLPVCTEAGDQFLPASTTDGSGGAIIAWTDTRSGSYDIYAQKVTAAGATSWAPNGIALCTARMDQDDEQIVADGAGGAIVVWRDSRMADFDIFAQRVSAAGAVLWTADGVALCTATGDQVQPTAASDGAGGVIVAWSDSRSGAGHIYAQRLNAAGVSQWTPNGLAVCTAAGFQLDPKLVADGAGGAIVAWADYRNGNYDIYAQRLDAAGSALWGANGVAVCLATGDQLHPDLTADGYGGAIVAWDDGRSGPPDIYVQRVLGGSVRWTSNGLALCTAGGNQETPSIVTDAAGGAIVVWQDTRSGNYAEYAQRVSLAGVPQWTIWGVPISSLASDQYAQSAIADGAGGAIITWINRVANADDIYAQRVNSSGVMQWTDGGAAISTADGSQSGPVSVSDDAGGAIIAWSDDRAWPWDIYAQRVDRFGYLGAEPQIASVRDVRSDQGGQVKVSWLPSYLDADPARGIGYYYIWRSVPPNAAARMLASGASLVTAESADWSPTPGRAYLSPQIAGATTIFWEYVGDMMASSLPGYSYVVPTTCDSIGGSNPRTLIMVQARASWTAGYWNSAPDSGYSVDNLAPAMPKLLASWYGDGSTRVRWQPNAETDLAGYRLYRGATADFVPAMGNLVTAQPDTGFMDTAAPLWSYYKLTAVDVHGNESPVATLAPAQITAVEPGAVPSMTSLQGARPNPFNPSTTISFSLAEAGEVTLVVFDACGRQVRNLVSGSVPAGRHEVRWDGRTDAGQPLASGTYFCRLEAGAYRETRRLTLVK